MLRCFSSNATLFEYQVVAVSMEIQDPFSTSIQEKLLMKTPGLQLGCTNKPINIV